MWRAGAQAGQTLIMFAVTLTFLFLGLIALVGDADVMMVEYSRVNAAALIGVQAGTTAVDLDAFYQGRRALDPAEAQTRCENAAEAVLVQYGGGQANCVPQGTQVTATVSKAVNLPIPMFGPGATVSVTRSGRAVFGGTTPQ